MRIAEVKALSAVNVDAERTVNKLNEEIKDLIRSIKTRVSMFSTGFAQYINLRA